jgi:hypothetical protein
MHLWSFFWLSTSTASGDAKLVLWTQKSPLSEMMTSCNCIPPLSKMPTLTYSWANSMHYIFNRNCSNGVVYFVFYFICNCKSVATNIKPGSNKSVIISSKAKVIRSGGTVNKIYHADGTVPKSNRKTKYTTPSEQFLNLTEKQNIPHRRNSS